MSDDSRFSSSEADALFEYQPIDRLAFTSLVLGISSVVALIHPLLWALPLAAVVVAFFALWRITVQDRQSGRRLALTGLGLALLFGSCSVTWTLSVNHMLSNEAKRCCETWLGMFRDGNLYEAHQLSMYHHERLTTDDPIEEIYTSPEAEKAITIMTKEDAMSGGMEPPEGHPAVGFKTWCGLPPVDTLSTIGPEMQFRLGRSLGTVHESPTDYTAKYVYIVSYEEDGHSRSLPVEITLERSVVDGTAHWHIANSGTYTEKL